MKIFKKLKALNRSMGSVTSLLTKDKMTIEPLEPRVLLNAAAAQLSNIDDIHAAPYNLDGTGITICEWDVGGAWDDHVSFVDGNITFPDHSDVEYNTHSTHVGGTMIGTGTGYVNPALASGMAPSATVKSYNFDDAWPGEMRNAAENGDILANISMGICCGWEFIDGTWYWFGDTRVYPHEDYKFGWYGPETRVFDDVLYDNPYFTVCMSAGNDRNDVPPPDGTKYYTYSTDTTLTLKTYDSGEGPDEDGISAGTQPGYDTINPQQSAKNCITVGAVDESAGAPGMVITSFSGYGPTDDGRIKPDIVADGQQVLSNYYTGPDEAPTSSTWKKLNGTSMATPVVTGGIALLQEYYKAAYAQTMPSAMVKGLICHTAAQCYTGAYIGPNYQTGWGLFDALAATQKIEADVDTTDMRDDLQWLTYSGDTIEISMYCPGGADPIKVTIAWTDPAGEASSQTIWDDSAKLVNDLDLVVREHGAGDTMIEHESWALSNEYPTDPATQTGNHVDNIEQVYISAPNAGWYTIVIDATKMGASTPNQDFVLLIDGLEERSELHTVGLRTSQPYLNRGVNPVEDPSGKWVYSTFQITNSGVAATGNSFEVKFYLSEDQTVDPNSDLLVGVAVQDGSSPDEWSLNPDSYVQPVSMGPGETIEVQVILDAPETDPFNGNAGGTYYLGIVVDSTNTITESNETNNMNRGLGIDITEVKYWPIPQGSFDIQPRDLSVGIWDMAVTATGSLEQTQVSVFLSDDSTPSWTDPHEQSFTIYSGATSGWSGSASLDDSEVSFSIPYWDIFNTDMEYYMSTWVRYYDGSDWSGWFQAGSPVTVYWSPQVYFSWTDENSLSGNVPADDTKYVYDISNLDEETVDMNWRLAVDRANIPAGTPVSVHYDLSQKPEFPGEFDDDEPAGKPSIHLGDDTDTDGCDRNDSSNKLDGSLTLDNIPESDPFGTTQWEYDILNEWTNEGVWRPTPYYITGYSDPVTIESKGITEYWTHNSNTDDRFPVCYYPDLVGVGMSCTVSSAGGASPIRPDSATVHFAVQSKYGVAFGDWDINFYLTTGDTIDPQSNTLLGSYHVDQRLQPDEVLSDTVTFPLNEEWTSAEFTYTVGMEIDYKSVNTEYPEHDDNDPAPRENNMNVGLGKDSTQFQLGADLQWVEVTPTNNTNLQWGDQVTLDLNIKNEGLAPAGESKVAVYAWTDQQYMIPLGEFVLSALSGSTETGLFQQSITLPDEAPPLFEAGQDICFNLLIDPDNSIDECDENNNSAWTLGSLFKLDINSTQYPRVLSQDPDTTVAAPVSSIDVTFNKPLSLTSFTANDVVITTPTGTARVQTIEHVVDNTYRINLRTELSDSGQYTMTLGPNILDTDGNSMDQNSDTVCGQNPDDQYTGTFTIDLDGPYISIGEFGSSTQGGVDYLDVTFSEPIDELTFTTDDILATGPGDITFNDVISMTEKSYRIEFDTPVVTGTYTMTIGPDITDLLGNLLNQDQDANNGETTDDVFSTDFTLDLSGPRVIEGRYGTGSGGTLDYLKVTFDETINASSFTVDDVTLSGPSGDIGITSVTYEEDNTYRITIDSQTERVQYTLTVGPNITDAGGNLMNQDDDGINGEAEDSYIVSFEFSPYAQIPLDSKTPVEIIDANGNTVSIKLTGPGSGNVLRIDNPLADIYKIELTNTTDKSRLSVKTPRGVQTGISQIVITGDINTIDGKGLILDEQIDVTGSLGKLTVDTFSDGASVNIDQAGRGLTVKANQIGDADFDLAGDVKSFTANTCTGGTVIADSIRKFQVKYGNCPVDITTRIGDIGNIMVTDDITGQFSSQADIGKIQSRVGTFEGTARAEKNIGRLSAVLIDNAILSAGGNIGTVTSKTDITDSMIMSGYDIGDNLLLESGESSSDDLLSSGDIKSVSAKGIFARSTISAGCVPDFTILDGGDLIGQLGRVKFGSLITDDTQPTFGIIANSSIKAVAVGRTKLLPGDTDQNFSILII